MRRYNFDAPLTEKRRRTLQRIRDACDMEVPNCRFSVGDGHVTITGPKGTTLTYSTDHAPLFWFSFRLTAFVANERYVAFYADGGFDQPNTMDIPLFSWDKMQRDTDASL